MRAWLRFAKWQLKSRLRDEVLIDWIEGQKLVIRHGMTGSTQNVYVGLHEFLDMMVPLHFLRKGDLFLDIGANVGTFTVLASGVCRARTFSFEPDSGTVAHLKRNIEINNLNELVQVYECALGAGHGDVAFTVGLDTVNRIATSKDTKTRMVRIATLDEIAADSDPVMMKVDVEGAELEVLSGAERVLANPSLRIVELETLVPESAKILARHRFELSAYDPFHRKLSKNPTSRQSSNSLFVRDWQIVEDRLQTARPIEVLGRMI